MSDEALKKAALDYHRNPRPGKLTITATKPLATQRDLALAYSPGVAAACEAIVDDPSEAAALTVRQNLVGVISNGSAVLGLGNIGALAAKPVMEGKAVLFKKFAGIDVFDIEVDEADPDKLVDIIAALEPTFGAINLEDIKSPECFIVERKLRERMNIPVFHDDQHGTAIVVAAALMNGLRVVGKDMKDVKLVSTGGGAAGIACLNLFVHTLRAAKLDLIASTEGYIQVQSCRRIRASSPIARTRCKPLLTFLSRGFQPPELSSPVGSANEFADSSSALSAFRSSAFSRLASSRAAFLAAFGLSRSIRSNL